MTQTFKARLVQAKVRTMSSSISVCKNEGCGTPLEWRKDESTGRNVPYERNGNRHNCQFFKKSYGPGGKSYDSSFTGGGNKGSLTRAVEELAQEIKELHKEFIEFRDATLGPKPVIE